MLCVDCGQPSIVLGEDGWSRCNNLECPRNKPSSDKPKPEAE
jgi:hypothetical protein